MALIFNASEAAPGPMAGEGSPLSESRRHWEELCAKPERAVWYDWFSLLRLAQCAFSEGAAIGCSVSLAEDPLRLGQTPYLNHPPSTVASLHPGFGESVPRVSSYHFGLFGPFGPLPTHLTELAHLQRLRGDPCLADFCDILHNRFLAFFFRAWAMTRREVALDRRGRADGSESWELFVGAFAGLGLQALRDRDRIPDHAKLQYAGRLLLPVRNAEGLQAILEDYFELDVAISEFLPRQMPIPLGNGCILGEASTSGSLGTSILVGQTVEDPQDGFRVSLGPLTLEQFEDFLPGGSGLAELCDWVRLYCGRQVEGNPAEGVEPAWDLRLVLREQEVPKLVLGESRTCRLGHCTWLLGEALPGPGVVVMVPSELAGTSELSVAEPAEERGSIPDTPPAFRSLSTIRTL